MPPNVRRTIAKRARPGATLCATAWPKGPYLAVGGAFADRASSTWWIACWWTAAAACGTSFARSAGGKSESLTGTSSNYWPKTAPHHAKALGVGRRVAVHVPDAHGHYDSPDSVLYEHNVVAMGAMEQANEDLWIVLADVVLGQERQPHAPVWTGSSKPRSRGWTPRSRAWRRCRTKKPILLTEERA